MLLYLLSISFAAIYFWLQLYYIYHWWKTPVLIVPEDYTPATGISVIVIARNEEKNIEKCIRSILSQKYPSHLFELILIDDRSDDNTFGIAKQIDHPSFQSFRLVDFPEFIHSPAFKKSGIELGVHLSKYDTIVVTDADCIHHEKWLRTHSYAHDHYHTVFGTGPVLIESKNNLLIKMQEMENLVLMVITAAGIRSRLHDIANGANMAFSKKVFRETNPYKDNYQFASGDDMFLVEKMRCYFPDRIQFVKSSTAVATTEAVEDWNALLKQRIRRARKNRGLQSGEINTIWLFVGSYHVMLAILFITALIDPLMWMSFAFMLGIKWIVDFILVHQASTFFERRFTLSDFVVLQFVYMIYVLRLGMSLLTGKKGDW